MRHFLKIQAIVVVLLLQPMMISGQSIISGHITEETTANPVPFANIWIKDTYNGTTADENGYFSLSADTLNTDKSVVISAIGYCDTIIPVGKIESETVLRQKVYNLSAVIVSPKKRETLIINDLTETAVNGGILSDTTPRITGRYFPFDERNMTFRYVKSVAIYTRDFHKGKFNLRLYSFDTLNLKPVEELVNRNIIVETRASKIAKPKPVEIDLSEYNIVFPDDGLLVCVEWLILPENRYTITMSTPDSKEKKDKIMYAPNLGATMDKEGYVYQYFKGFWWKTSGAVRSDGSVPEKRYFNPAISLTLTD